MSDDWGPVGSEDEWDDEGPHLALIVVIAVAYVLVIATGTYAAMWITNQISHWAER